MTDWKEIRRRLRCLIGVLALSAATLYGQGIAQAPASSPAKNLELRLHPGALRNGVPIAFTFALVNISNHDVRVPEPSVECGSGYSGSIWITVRFTPLHPTGSGTGLGCAGDRDHWPPILERAQKWTLLHPTESLTGTMASNALHTTLDQPGSYEFWADYAPPSIDPDERNKLAQARLDFPHDPLTTAHLTFTKEPAR